MKLNNNDDSHNSGLNLLIYNMLLDIESHPTWVCGLKHFVTTSLVNNDLVTPYVGVWIETCHWTRGYHGLESHPTWVCGLKLTIPQLRKTTGTSHPTWVCGLKQLTEGEQYPEQVTPYVGVWIETTN